MEGWRGAWARSLPEAPLNEWFRDRWDRVSVMVNLSADGLRAVAEVRASGRGISSSRERRGAGVNSKGGCADKVISSSVTQPCRSDSWPSGPAMSLELRVQLYPWLQSPAELLAVL